MKSEYKRFGKFAGKFKDINSLFTRLLLACHLVWVMYRVDRLKGDSKRESKKEMD